MRTFLKTLCLAVMVSWAVDPHGALGQVVQGGLESVSFLVGCWAQPAPEGNGLREIYAPPADNMMTGLSQFWWDGRIVDWEFHRIDQTDRGPALTPHPRGVASVSFEPVELDSGLVVWQNLEHDFPQNIIYQRSDQDTLVARIQGGDGDGARSMEWKMARTPCPD